MGAEISQYTNNDNILPMNIDNHPWLYENDEPYRTSKSCIDRYNTQQEKINNGKCIYEYERGVKCDENGNLITSCPYSAKKNYYCGYHKHQAYNPDDGLVKENILIPKPTIITEGSMCNCGCNIRHIVNYENKENIGKWMLFYDINEMNEKWKLAKQLYRENKLKGVISMKCSTNMKNPRASCHSSGIIIMYCNNSNDEYYIKNIGENIINNFNYTYNPYIYYKTDKQTREGTRTTGKQKNYTYCLCTERYYSVGCLIDVSKLE